MRSSACRMPTIALRAGDCELRRTRGGRARPPRPRVSRHNVRVTRIAIIPGDGIGPEVCAVALRVLSELEGVCLESETFPWGSDYYLRPGRMLPRDALETLAGFDAIL